MHIKDDIVGQSRKRTIGIPGKFTPESALMLLIFVCVPLQLA
jgi:hypothetical protein